MIPVTDSFEYPVEDLEHGGSVYNGAATVEFWTTRYSDTGFDWLVVSMTLSVDENDDEAVFDDERNAEIFDALRNALIAGPAFAEIDEITRREIGDMSEAA